MVCMCLYSQTCTNAYIYTSILYTNSKHAVLASFYLVLFYVHITQMGVITEKGTSVEEMTLSDWSLGKSVRNFLLLIIDAKGPSPLGLCHL